MTEGFQTVLAASDEERRDLFVGAADRLRTDEQNIEKDFWVCWTLDALFNELEAGGPRLLFKGGTSLSKGYGLIERFSEDIDITVFREDIGQPATFEELEAMSSKKRNARLEAIKAACQEYIQGPMLERLSASTADPRDRKYQPDHVWQQEQIFEALTNVDILAAVKVKNSVYERVPVDSKVKQVFAEGLDQRHLTFKLFLKLPHSFTVRSPVGEYQPDWAILKQDGEMLYLVRETKGSRNYQKLRTSEAYKVQCGQKHFGALGVSFGVVENLEQV